MRFEIVDHIRGNCTPKELPRGLNPVRIGSSEANNDIVLASAYVGPQAARILNDGTGWKVINLTPVSRIKVGTSLLPRVGDAVPLADGQVIVFANSFSVKVFFDADEFLTEADEVRRRDRACADLVHEVYGQLLAQFSAEGELGKRDLQDAFIVKLERAVEELASGRKDFPADDFAQTELANHLAGVAVRSLLLHELIGGAGGKGEAKPREGWERPRIYLADYEQKEVPPLLQRVREAVGLTPKGDLTEQMRVVEEGFWPAWGRMQRADKAGAPPLRRYLALRRLREEIKFTWYGFGPLQDLLADPTVSEIMVVDHDHVFIEKSGKIENSGRRFLGERDLEEVIKRIVSTADRHVDKLTAMVDARMPDGSRVNAVIPPLARRGSCLTIRRFPAKGWTSDDLVRDGSLTPAARDFLRAAVVNRRNVLVAGGTGTGKTTLLNCLSGFIPDKERIVTIEDTAELKLQKEHVVQLEARPANVEGRGEVTIRDLVKNSLRMRPDRIVVGECRGAEAIDMLQAMNTGHDGSMTTIHANSPSDVVLRLEVLVQQNAEMRLPVESIHRQIVSAIDLVVQLQIMEIGGKRAKVVSEIAEVVAVEEGGGVRLVSLFDREEGGPLRPTGRLATFLPGLIGPEPGQLADPECLLARG